MSANGGEQPAIVNIGPCLCSGGADPSPHPDGDTVSLAPKPSLRLGAAANAAMLQAEDLIQFQEFLVVTFIRYGVIGWNLVDDKSQPLPLTPDAVEARLTWDAGGLQVADAAAELYGDAVVTPLVARLSNSAGNGQKEPSTSPSLQSSPIPTSSKPSSRSRQATTTPSEVITG